MTYKEFYEATKALNETTENSPSASEWKRFVELIEKVEANYSKATKKESK